MSRTTVAYLFVLCSLIFGISLMIWAIEWLGQVWEDWRENRKNR